MAIYLPIPFEPFMGTDEQWKAFFKVQSTASLCYMSYTKTIGVFAIFSRKKRLEFKKSLSEYKKARDDYYRVLGVVK